MSWSETCPMKERIKFILAYETNTLPFSELCKDFQISRKTGYKWVNRYKGEGFEGLENQSRARLHHPNQLSEEIECLILDAKRERSHWGPYKLIKWLKQEYSHLEWPASSTAGDLLKRHGLVKPRKKRIRTPPYTQPFERCAASNDVWSIDYKGQFMLGNGQYCYPLTLTDNYSRYLLACDAFEAISGLDVRKTLIRLFREHGLPKAIKSDNGSPFSTRGLAGLSRLAVWWIKLGIIPERIKPGCPQENGRHERMHLTMKQEVATPPKKTMLLQQSALDAFQDEFNHHRPHEGINNKRPAWLFTQSSRVYPEKIPQIEYDANIITRKIRTNGTMKWRGEEIFVSETLTGERIGLIPISDLEWKIQFSQLSIGVFNEKLLKVRALNG
ncbi:MAG: transposase [Tatlockia sp.]|nr:transposase [Tatlockia sp.]